VTVFQNADARSFQRAMRYGEDDTELDFGGDLDDFRLVHVYPHHAVEFAASFRARATASPNSRRRRFRRTDSEVDELFVSLRDEWQSETAAFGSVFDRIMHHSYQRIIGLGPQVVPLILDELLDDETLDHWFWALAMIVGYDAAPGASTLDEAAKLWTEWASVNGLMT
jgi:hypothetical protein